jgi:hypothetical protein
VDIVLDFLVESLIPVSHWMKISVFNAGRGFYKYAIVD